jgi:hypothetical protein
MSRLDSAFERFNQAIDRLEGALRASAPKSNGASGGAERKLEVLKADRDQLALALEEARSDYANLQSLTDEVETRLDVAIENIRKIMRG